MRGVVSGAGGGEDGRGAGLPRCSARRRCLFAPQRPSDARAHLCLGLPSQERPGHQASSCSTPSCVRSSSLRLTVTRVLSDRAICDKAGESASALQDGSPSRVAGAQCSGGFHSWFLLEPSLSFSPRYVSKRLGGGAKQQQGSPHRSFCTFLCTFFPGDGELSAPREGGRQMSWRHKPLAFCLGKSPRLPEKQT